MPSHVAHNARFLAHLNGTQAAARYLRALGYPLDRAIEILTRK